MKRILFLILTLPTLTFASGKFSLQPSYYFGAKKFMPMAGLGIYEKIIPGLYYNGWSGLGLQPRDSGNLLWISSKHDVETHVDRFTFALGFTYRIAEKASVEYPDESDVHLKVTYQLW